MERWQWYVLVAGAFIAAVVFGVATQSIGLSLFAFMFYLGLFIVFGILANPSKNRNTK